MAVWSWAVCESRVFNLRFLFMESIRMSSISPFIEMNRYLWINIDVVHCVAVAADATVTAGAACEPINDCGGFDAHWRNYVLAKISSTQAKHKSGGEIETVCTHAWCVCIMKIVICNDPNANINCVCCTSRSLVRDAICKTVDIIKTLSIVSFSYSRR